MVNVKRLVYFKDVFKVDSTCASYTAGDAGGAVSLADDDGLPPLPRVINLDVGEQLNRKQLDAIDNGEAVLGAIDLSAGENAELINGRIAMLGITAAVAAEYRNPIGDDIEQQFALDPLLIVASVVAVAAASKIGPELLAKRDEARLDGRLPPTVADEIAAAPETAR